MNQHSILLDLELINELREYGLQYVVDKYSLVVRYHDVWPNLVLLKYNQLETNLSHKAARQARGIILDSEDDWRVVAYPYDKFFNYGEPLAASIEWDTAVIYEKLDGTLCTLYWYRDQWNVATSGSPDASGVCNNGKITFVDLFWRVFYELDYKLPKDTKLCYMFELMTPDNEIVVKHSAPRLVLHGVRDISHWPYPEMSVDLEYKLKYNWEVVRQFDKTSSLDELLGIVSNIDGTSQEGFVVRDINFNRIKVKAPSYVELHYFANNFSDKRLLRFILENEHFEILSYLDKHKDKILELQHYLYYLVNDIDKTYRVCNVFATQKDFAMEAKQYPWSGILFGLRNGRFSTIHQGLLATKTDLILEWIERYYAETGDENTEV